TAEEGADAYLLAEAATRRSRLLLTQGLPEQATWDGLEEDLPATRGERGEFLATQALARACLGDFKKASELSSMAQDVTRSAQVRVLVPSVRAIISLVSEGPEGQDDAEHAFSEVLRICEWDVFVCVYRAYPPLLAAVARRAEWRQRLGEVLLRARDEATARKLKLPLPRRRKSPHHPLTPRELEVLELLKQGLANKEIGRTLYISESTAKVHVRHILEKLGVRTRTAAAVKGIANFP